MLTAISKTEASISAMPVIRRSVSDSPNMQTPMTTAVSGSSASVIAVGVDPTILTDLAMNTRERTVGTSPSMAPQPHWFKLVGIAGKPEPKNVE